jgi:hypothetical protein
VRTEGSSHWFLSPKVSSIRLERVPSIGSRTDQVDTNLEPLDYSRHPLEGASLKRIARMRCLAVFGADWREIRFQMVSANHQEQP